LTKKLNPIIPLPGVKGALEITRISKITPPYINYLG
jgi:hypothetical protein